MAVTLTTLSPLKPGYVAVMTSPLLSAVVNFDAHTKRRPFPVFLSATGVYVLPWVSAQPTAPANVPVATDTTAVSPAGTPPTPTVAVMLLLPLTLRELPVTGTT